MKFLKNKNKKQKTKNKNRRLCLSFQSTKLINKTPVTRTVSCESLQIVRRANLCLNTKIAPNIKGGQKTPTSGTDRKSRATEIFFIVLFCFVWSEMSLIFMVAQTNEAMCKGTGWKWRIPLRSFAFRFKIVCSGCCFEHESVRSVARRLFDGNFGRLNHRRYWNDSFGALYLSFIQPSSIERLPNAIAPPPPKKKKRNKI
jgi:hypothetical protein